MNADQIIVIKKGRVVEKGSHDQLLDAKGMYFQLWSKQSKPDDPPLNPVSKTPLLIEDLFDASTRDETGCHDSSRDVATSSQNLEQILIPEAAKGSIRTTSTPTVAFSLPERTVWGPEPRSQPSINPRMAAPNHGILKNPTRLQGLGSNNRGLNTPSKPASLLKPDAKEFVPRGYSVVARDSTTDTFSGGVIPAETIAPRPSTPKEMSLEGILANQIEVESLKVKELVEETLFDGPNPGKTAPTQEGGQTLTVTCLNNTNIEAAESTGEDVGNTEPEIDNTQEARKRRRRVRRRSNKLRSGESEENTDAKQNSSEGTETEAVADIADSPAAIEGEGPQAIGGNVGSSNGSVVKPKRRFRNGNKLKNNGSEFDTEAPLSAPLSALPATGNGTAMFKVRPRTGFSNRSGTKLPYKEGQPPENGQQSDCLTSSSKRENMQRRNSGGDKCQEQRNGTWHKGLKKSKSSESGNSASES